VSKRLQEVGLVLESVRYLLLETTQGVHKLPQAVGILSFFQVDVERFGVWRPQVAETINCSQLISCGGDFRQNLL